MYPPTKTAHYEIHQLSNPCIDQQTTNKTYHIVLAAHNPSADLADNILLPAAVVATADLVVLADIVVDGSHQFAVCQLAVHAPALES